ncbi:Gfo/Idh/MocA family oxidoreductase [Novosphingobium sp.]|uniref:Gfo/Idh/MocA family protein n=1 Tax=Novosphingobium sp. TaxID=1874826 RepID=UPI00286D79FC|nr:Gfo/Idh/MocA family oxidoreductase [Novosphingobium sp.]
MPSEQAGVVLVGCGRISASHLRAIAELPEDYRLIATVDRDIGRADEAAAPFGAMALASLDHALALPGVTCVILCTPNGDHAQQAMASLKAGKHVLVEKPLAETGEQARALATEAQRQDLVLAAGHTFRHCAPVNYLLDHVAELGRLRAVEVSSCVFWDGPQAPWWAERTPEEGLIVSLFAPHSLDFIQLAMGDVAPTRVHAEGARHQSGWQGEDEAMIVLAYPGRRMATLHLSYNQLPIHDRKVLFFEKGVMEIIHGETLLWNGAPVIVPPPGMVTDPGRMGGRDLAHYFRGQLAEFAKAMRREGHRCPSGAEAALGIELLDRVRASLRANSAEEIDPPPKG